MKRNKETNKLKKRGRGDNNKIERRARIQKNWRYIAWQRVAGFVTSRWQHTQKRVRWSRRDSTRLFRSRGVISISLSLSLSISLPVCPTVRLFLSSFFRGTNSSDTREIGARPAGDCVTRVNANRSAARWSAPLGRLLFSSSLLPPRASSARGDLPIAVNRRQRDSNLFESGIKVIENSRNRVPRGWRNHRGRVIWNLWWNLWRKVYKWPESLVPMTMRNSLSMIQNYLYA